MLQASHRYGNSHAIWDHAVLPATRQRWHSRLAQTSLNCCCLLSFVIIIMIYWVSDLTCLYYPWSEAMHHCWQHDGIGGEKCMIAAVCTDCLRCYIGDNGMRKRVRPRPWPPNCCVHKLSVENLQLLQRSRVVIHVGWWCWWWCRCRCCFMRGSVRDGSQVYRRVVSWFVYWLLLRVLFRWTNSGGSSPKILHAWLPGKACSTFL